MAPIPESSKSKAGLVLTGGGARAAFQVGVLKAVKELLPSSDRNPFPILCGTSAGAINAATLAVFADNFHAAVADLRHEFAFTRPGAREPLVHRGRVVTGMDDARSCATRARRTLLGYVS